MEVIAKTRFGKRKSLYDSIVYVIVGSEKEKFGMHKGLLCEYSAFFRTALKGNYFEAASREIHLEEDRVVDFDLFNGWLYNQTLLAKGQTVDEILWDTLIDLYLFADKRAIPSLMNAVVDLLIAKLESSPITTLILLYEKCAYVYSQTTKGSLLRQLVADSYACWASMFEYFRGIPEEDLPIEFIYDVALAYIKLHPEHSDGNFTILDAAEFYHTEAMELLGTHISVCVYSKKRKRFGSVRGKRTAINEGSLKETSLRCLSSQ